MDFDVVIVGASAAGIYASELLAKEGVDVALFEREEEINPPRRTYIITPGLSRVMKDIPSSLVLYHISAFTLETKNEEVTIPLAKPDLILERNQIRRTLGERAKQAGVSLHMGLEFKGFREVDHKERFVFVDERGKETIVSAGTIVGADGVTSTVAQQAGIPKPFTVPLLQSEIKLPESWPKGLTKVWFDMTDTRYFYWLIPESDSRAVVGLIGEPDRDIKALLTRFMNEQGFHSLSLQSGRVGMYHPQLKPWGRVGDVDVFLVGDAAGQVKVTTVGGTVTGFWGARAVARAIKEGKPYAETIQSLKKELDIHWWIRYFLDRLGNRSYDRLVSKITPQVVRFLGKYDRDEVRRHFWMLPFIQPGFIPFGISLLLHQPNHELLPLTKSATEEHE